MPGVFKNPAEEVASLYWEALRAQLARHRNCFECIAFAIIDPGYGEGSNTTIFRGIFSGKMRLATRSDEEMMLDMGSEEAAGDDSME